MKALIILLALSNLNAISTAQVKTAKMVKKEAKKYTKWYMEVVGICGTETRYGIDRENNEGTYGLMQISPDAVRWIARKHKHLRYLYRMNNWQIKYILISNDKLSIEIAARMINFLIRHKGRDIGVKRYNGINNSKYLIKVNKNIKYITKVLKCTK